MNKHYRPLPEGLTIKSWALKGCGTAMKGFRSGYNFGIMHAKDDRLWDKYIRTPLSGF